MNLQNLRVFLKVAELEHVTRAAEELNLTQPAVTKIIQSLEQELHLALIERQGRHIVLTHAGHVLQTHARQLFAYEREMEDSLALLRDVERGEVNLSVNPTVGVYLLPPIVYRFRQRYPDIKLNISIQNSQEVVEGILDWKLDFGIVEGDVTRLPSGLDVRFFARDQLILVVAPTHPWCNQEVTLQMLSDSELLMREQGSAVREEIERGLADLGVRVRPMLTLMDNEAIKQMVMNRVGAALVSNFSVHRELVNGDLVQIPLSMNLQPQLSFIQRSDKQLSRAAQAFHSFLFPLV
jgi:DNA-binding transcriptional LysR family regulator